jgi:hypothetical protein
MADARSFGGTFNMFSEISENSTFALSIVNPLLYMTTKVCRHIGHTCRRLAAVQKSSVQCSARSSSPSVAARSLTTSTQVRPRPRHAAIHSPSRRRYHYYTHIEKDHERIITTSMGRIEEFDKASKALSEGSGVDEAIELSRILKELGPLKNTWEEYTALRKVRFHSSRADR